VPATSSAAPIAAPSTHTPGARSHAEEQHDAEHRDQRVGLRRDQDAVTAGLTREHSSGAVEGAVNRIKMLKRQMFGRAGFDLLRTRILLA
jgi:transposase